MDQAIAASPARDSTSDKTKTARRKSLLRLSLFIFVIELVVFVLSPLRLPTDSRWSVHTALSFARGHGGDLSEFLPILEQEKFYAIEHRDGSPRSRYPIGPSLLAAPVVAVLAIARPNWANELSTKIPARTEQFIASLVGATTGVIFFWIIFSRFESIWIGLASTAILAFGTSIWSTATRALWQHGPLVLMLSIAMLLLVRARRRPELIQFVGLPLAMGYLMRPTGIVPLGILSLYVLFYHRQWAVRYLAWPALVAVPWLAYNLSIYGTPLPAYYAGEAFNSQTRFVEGLLGNLFSPSRGLFVFSPVLLFSISGFFLSLRDVDQRPLHLAFGLIVICHSIIVGAASMWWAGHAFGPRFMTDILPILVYFVAFNFRLPASAPARLQRPLSAAVIVLALASSAIHAQGAWRYGTWQWNTLPDSIDQHPSRAWDWSDPQFLRTYREH